MYALILFTGVTRAVWVLCLAFIFRLNLTLFNLSFFFKLDNFFAYIIKAPSHKAAD